MRRVGDQFDSCPATEARLTSEFRRNPYARALLLSTMARFRTARVEQKALMAQAMGLLRQEVLDVSVAHHSLIGTTSEGLSCIR